MKTHKAAAMATSVADDQKIIQSRDLIDDIDQEASEAIDLADMLANVCASVHPGGENTLNLDEIAPGLSVAAGVIRDKIAEVKEKADQMHMIAGGAA